MSSFWDRWATIHRNSRALVMLIAIAIWGAWALIAKIQLDNDPLLGVTETTGVVTTLHPINSKNGSANMVFGDVALEDGTKVRLMLADPVPATGATVPLRAEKYTSGKILYAVDSNRWRMGNFP